MENDTLPIGDEVWSAVVQFVQFAMLTGTDITDYLRLIRVKPGQDEFGVKQLVLAPGQVELFDKQVKELLDKVALLKDQSNAVQVTS